MRLDCTCAFSVYFSESEMWIVPIIKSINWNIGPHHVQLDFSKGRPLIELEAWFLDLLNYSAHHTIFF